MHTNAYQFLYMSIYTFFIFDICVSITCLTANHIAFFQMGVLVLKFGERQQSMHAAYKGIEKTTD